MKEYTTLTAFFEELCPQMMALGMSYEDFWYGDPEIVPYAIEAAMLRHKQEMIAADLAAWNTGRYVMVGVGTVLSHAFGKSHNAAYPKEPELAAELDERLAKMKRERELRESHAQFLAVAARLAQQKAKEAK